MKEKGKEIKEHPVWHWPLDSVLANPNQTFSNEYTDRKNIRHYNSSDEWQWSSAFGRKYGLELAPDAFQVPVLIPDAQAQRIGAV